MENTIKNENTERRGADSEL